MSFMRLVVITYTLIGQMMIAVMHVYVGNCTVVDDISKGLENKHDKHQ